MWKSKTQDIILNIEKDMEITVKQLYAKICNILKNSEIEDFTFEADCILEDICGIDRETRIMNPDRTVSDDIIKKTEICIKKRSKHYPLQYLLGNWEFYGRTFKVGKGVLIPRQDTEILAETAVEFLNSQNGQRRAMDLFGGSGCVAVTMAKEVENSEIYSVEYEKSAYKYLCENSKKYGNCVKTILGDAISHRIAHRFDNSFNAITANPPYLTRYDMVHRQDEVKYEPSTALYGGSSGLYYYRKVIPLWKDSLVTGGMMAVEIGATQGNAVAKIFEKFGYSNVTVKKDFAGLDRVVYGVKS